MRRNAKTNVPNGTFTNLPAWECLKCATWQTGIDAKGHECGPKTCEVCVVPTKFRRENGIALCHVPIVKALAAKGWMFDFQIRLSVGLIPEGELRAAIVHAAGYRGLAAEETANIAIPAEKLVDVWRAVFALPHRTPNEVTRCTIAVALA